MTLNELKNFKLSELSGFTYAELGLNVDELLEKVKNDNRSIPISVYEKLQNLCQDMKSEKGLSTEISKNIPNANPKFTVAQALTMIVAIITILDKMPDLIEKYSVIINEIITMLNNLQ